MSSLSPALLSDNFRESVVSGLNFKFNLETSTLLESEDVNVKINDAKAVWKVSLQKKSLTELHLIFEIKQPYGNPCKDNTFKVTISSEIGTVLFTSSDYFLRRESKLDINLPFRGSKCMLKFSVSFCSRHKMIDTTSVCKKIIENNINMQNDPKYSDFTFIVDGKEFKVHKNILAATSQVFATLFDSKMKESRENKCIIKTIDSSVFGHMLNFIYGAIVPADIKDISIGLYGAAHYYQIKDLMDICKNVIRSNLSAVNAQEAYVCASLYDMEDLKEDAKKIGGILESSATARETIRQVLARKKKEISMLEELEALASKLCKK